MSDVSKFGPLGEGEESRPLKVDLTRIDIRRGTLNLPRRFYDAFPAGKIDANDTVEGTRLEVSFVPPRELEGLGPFFEQHGLQPNDAVAIAIAGGLQLTPIKRERRRSEDAPAPRAIAREPEHDYRPEAPAEGGVVRERVRLESREEPLRPTPSGGGQVRERVRLDSREEAKRASPEDGKTQERVRLEAQQLGRETPAGGDGPTEREQTRVRLTAQEPAAYLAPPVPETKGGWQDVLHDPAPRRGQMLRPSERAVVRPDDLPARASAERSAAGDPRSGSKQQGLFGEQAERFGTVREAQREEGRLARRVSAGSEPLARRQEADGEQPTAARGSAGHEGSESRGPGERHGRTPQEKPAATTSRQQPAHPSEAAEAREPVLVGGAQAEGDVTSAISRYLKDPKTPAIVRAAALAQELSLPLDAVRKGLAEVSSRSEGSVTSIREDVYLVKRGR